MSKPTVRMIFIMTGIIIGSLLFYHGFYHESQTVDEEIVEYTGTRYMISDNYTLPGHKSMNEIIDEDGIVDRINELHDMLSCSEYFTYFEVYDQLLQYEGYYDKGYEFLDVPKGLSEEEMNEYVNQKVLSGEETILLTNIKGMFIGEKTFEQLLSLQDHIVTGESFKPEDFMYDDVVNVILGNGYADLYEVGDQIKVEYICEPIVLNVVGFLDDSATVDIGNTHINLDAYILVPSFKIVSQEKKGRYYNVTHSLYRTNGIIEINDNVDIKTGLDACDAAFDRLNLDYGYFPLDE